MNKIIVLENHIANQIAAGEVVERPSSVIKELLENALDAGSSSIEVRIKDGGLSFILVEDNGYGIEEDDLPLALARHATSKLLSANDLSLGLISTFGFRGEALPSIASVSNFSITSKTQDMAHANQIICKNGKIIDQSKAGAKDGTRVLVKDLFYNVPARLKFVKSKRAENCAIDKLIRCFAFVTPHVSWKFFCDDKPVLMLSSGEESTYERAISLLGDQCKGHIYPIKQQSDLMLVEGMIASPLVSVRDTRNIHVFVNDRLICDKKLVTAIKVAFRSLLEVGNNPSLAINIKMDKALVDVNVHPRKTEVRFADEGRVFSHIVRILSSFLAKTPWLTPYDQKSFSAKPLAQAFYKQPVYEQDIKQTKEEYDFLFEVAKEKPKANFSMLTTNYEEPVAKSLMPEEKYSDLKIMGQFHNLYILLESSKGLVILDQHAAHERVMFERIIKKKQEEFLSHPLLVPIKIDLSFGQKNLLEQHLEDFSRLGFDLENFGEKSIIIRSIPDFFRKENVENLILDILSEFEEFSSSNQGRKMFDHMCATIACHSSIRAGQKLHKEEMEQLLLELDKIDFNAHCPHGRPIVKWFNQTEIKKWFHRP